MLTSMALIFLCGLFLGVLLRRMGLPPLLGMLLAGMALGPHALNLLAGPVLAISGDLRRMALIIILTQAGLSLDLGDLRQVGRPALLLCFMPACFEIAGMLLLAPTLLGVSPAEAALIGAVVAAVSPAVVVPKMLQLMEQGYGTEKHIPQMIVAGASVDDVFVIVLFTAFTDLARGGEFSPLQLLGIPVSIALGLLAGLLLGCGLAALFRRVRMGDTVKILLLLSLSFLLLELEELLQGRIPFAGLLAVMAMGVALRRRQGVLAERLSARFSRLWVAAEILLFVLVGATVDPRYALAAGGAAVLAILGALALRMLGVQACLLGTGLSGKERLFCMIAYCPKATVQAAIGALPLGMGLPCGGLVLTVAVLAIIITAPLGAVGVEKSYRHLLQRQLTTGG